jgi:small conductance mechanosensitive channel
LKTLETHVWTSVDDIWASLIRISVILLISGLTLKVITGIIERYRKLYIGNDVSLVVSPSAKRVETIATILRNVLMSVVMVGTGLLILGEMGINLLPFLAGASILGVAIGLGTQTLVKDLFYGFCIILENQFGIGDVVKIGEAIGQVEKMTLRAITLRDLEQRVHVIPSGEASKVVVYTRERSGMVVTLEFFAPELTVESLYSQLNKLHQQFTRDFSKELVEGPTLLGVDALRARGMVVKVYAKTLPNHQDSLRRNYLRRIKETFDLQGIPVATL